MHSTSLTTQAGFFRRPVLLALVTLVIFGVGSQVLQAHTHADAAVTEVESGLANACMDDYQNKPDANNKVVAWDCNDSPAQVWAVKQAVIEHGQDCLSVADDAQAAGSLVQASTCSGAPGQIWLRDGGSYFNPNSGLCLTASKLKAQLTISGCTQLSQPTQMWIPITSASDSGKPNCANVTKGQRLACFAEQDWTDWQAAAQPNGVGHLALLNKYTLNTSYEEWCADFVSYVYKQAGYAFTGGEAQGWDENDANKLQNMGFTMHRVSDGYVPKAGDVAYFDYTGGHVEVVISGGAHPTFVYGNSAAIDPATGNGQMQANSITTDKLGEVSYYLSPELN